jgi:conjugal transfer pilin signal peptidase TrbI
MNQGDLPSQTGIINNFIKNNDIEPIGWRWYRLYIPLALVITLTFLCYSFTLNYKLVFVGNSDRCIPGWLFVVKKGVLPKAGELAMVLSHETDIMPSGVKIIKLVAGVAGDTVKVDKYKVVNASKIYYAPLEEAALFLEKNVEDLTGNYIVPNNSYFMIGTFPGSYDSRFFGAIVDKQVVGRAYLII